jgi:hypothetical protein
MDLGKTLQSRIKEFFDSPIDGACTPLEIVQGALAVLERKVQPVGRGRRVFPYNRVTVRVGPGIADKASLQAAFERFDEKLAERLAELKCSVTQPPVVRLAFMKRAPAEWAPNQVFSVECWHEVDAQAPVDPLPPQPALEIAIVRGAASQSSYAFTQPVVAVGRTEDPIDDRGNVRRNHVVFLDTVDGATETVGRAHARLEFDAAHREYRIFNESSSNPTFISRDGTMIQVRPRDPRGVRVRSGDEIRLGRAVMRISTTEAPAASAPAAERAVPATADIAD